MVVPLLSTVVQLCPYYSLLHLHSLLMLNCPQNYASIMFTALVVCGRDEGMSGA